MKGEFICRADRVTETHPLANEMGDIKDIEDYKHKIEKQQKLRRKTIKAVREHFNLDDIDLIEKELLNLPQKIAQEKAQEMTQDLAQAIPKKYKNLNRKLKLQ